MDLASIDGRIGPAAKALIPATDHGLLRGDGAFEVMRLYGGVPFALDDHLLRLAHSAERLRLEIDMDALRAEIAALLAAMPEEALDGTVRVVATRGGLRLLLTEPLPDIAPSIRLASVTYAPTRILDGVKSLSYAANMLAGRLARERDAAEALLVTPHGRVLEAPTSSFFWVRDGRVFTPPLEEHILASITRERIMGEVVVTEAHATLDDLRKAEEAFIASTTREIQPVAAVDDIEWAAPGPETEHAAAALRARIADELAHG